MLLCIVCCFLAPYNLLGLLSSKITAHLNSHKDALCSRVLLNSFYQGSLARPVSTRTRPFFAFLELRNSPNTFLIRQTCHVLFGSVSHMALENLTNFVLEDLQAYLECFPVL